MNDEIPYDADGDALRRLKSTGADLTKPMEIDFSVVIPDQDSGAAFAKVAQTSGFQTKVYKGAHSNRWTCECTCNMVPAYDAIVAIQKKLEDIGLPYGAKPDGWGSFGNG
jgi:hypothetical protein